MITNIVVQWLYPGEIPTYDMGPSELMYTLQPGPPRTTAGSPTFEGLYWDCRTLRGRRAFIDLNIDVEVDIMMADMDQWLHMVHAQNPDVPGTLMVIIRSKECFPGEERQYFNGGFAFFPIPIPNGLPLDVGVSPADFVRRVLATESHEAFNRDPVLSRFDYPLEPLTPADQLAASYVPWRVQQEEERGVQRARVLLYQHLTIDQIIQVEEHKQFVCRGKDKKTYSIHALPMHNVFLLDAQGRRRMEFCLVTKQRIPVYDLMLLQKFLLESDPELFWREANCWTLDLDGTKQAFRPATEQHNRFENAIRLGLERAQMAENLGLVEQRRSLNPYRNRAVAL